MANENQITPRRDPYRLNGEVFGKRYRIEAFVSSGSFGAVYRAFDSRLNKIVAVKVLKPDLKDDLAETARELFQREALTAASLDHQHIVRVTDVGEEFDFAYMVMEWLEGRTLEHEIKTRRVFSPDYAAQILSDIADAIHTAHTKGIIHRDIKPSNIHLGSEGQTLVKVLDFGIAKVINSASQATASRIAGTLEYASPEQISGGRIDRRSDIYSLGIMAYQMLTGELPFKADSEAHLIQMQLMEVAPRISETHTHLPEAISAVIEKALSKMPEYRFQSAVEFKQAFVDALYQSKSRYRISEEQTLLARTKASPPDTEETQFIPEQKRIMQFVSGNDDLQTEIAKPRGTEETQLAPGTHEKEIEQPTPVRRKFYALRYALGGALFMLVFRYFMWKEVILPETWKDSWKWEQLFGVDVILGLLFGAIISEMRPFAWWSVAGHRRLKAFVIYALTGAGILYGGVWLIFNFKFFLWLMSASPEGIDLAQLADGYISESHYLINQFVPVLILIGIILGLVVCAILVVASRATKDKQPEIVLPVKDDNTIIRISLIIGFAFLSFIISLIFYSIVNRWVGGSNGLDGSSFFRVIYHTILGATFGAIVGQFLRPSSSRWSVAGGHHGNSILLHGFTAVFILHWFFALQRIVWIYLYTYGETASLQASLTLFQRPAEPFWDMFPTIKDYLYLHYRPFSLLIFRIVFLDFTVGVIVWFARTLAHKTKRHGLFITVAGALCGFVLSHYEWTPVTSTNIWLPYLLLNILIGAMFFASLSELRRGALWSIERGHRVKSFLVHVATGITVVMGIGWLIWYFNLLTETRLRFQTSSVYLLLSVLAIIGFISGLIVCGARLGISAAMSEEN